MWHPIKHYKTIRHHKMLVMKNCFRCGLYWQGLTHDLSKLAPVEFWAGAKYWQGTCIPNNAQRQAEGYSAAWLHHKGRAGRRPCHGRYADARPLRGRDGL